MLGRIESQAVEKIATTLNIWLLSLCMTTFKTYKIQNHGVEEPL